MTPTITITQVAAAPLRHPGMLGRPQPSPPSGDPHPLMHPLSYDPSDAPGFGIDLTRDQLNAAIS